MLSTIFSFAAMAKAAPAQDSFGPFVQSPSAHAHAAHQLGNASNATFGKPFIHLAYFASVQNGGNPQCSITQDGDGVYYSMLGGEYGGDPEYNNTCSEMEAPADGWTAIASSLPLEHYYYQLAWDPKTNATVTLKAFCTDSDCDACTVSVGGDAGPMPEMKVCQTGISSNSTSTSDLATSFFLIEPDTLKKKPGHDFCVLDQLPSDTTDLITELRYNGRAPQCAMKGEIKARIAVARTFVAPSGKCVSPFKDAYVEVRVSGDSVSGGLECTFNTKTDNCGNTDNYTQPDCELQLPTNYRFGDCIPGGIGPDDAIGVRLMDTADNGKSFSQTTGLPKCFDAPNITPTYPPTGPATTAEPVAGGKKKVKMSVVIGAAAGAAALLITLVIVVLKRRANSMAYHELGGVSTYSE